MTIRFGLYKLCGKYHKLLSFHILINQTDYGLILWAYPESWWHVRINVEVENLICWFFQKYFLKLMSK